MFGREKPAPQQSQPVGSPNQYGASLQHPGTPSGVPAPKIETVIGPNCRINGMLQSDGGIRIEGIFEGQIQTTGNLIIADSAKVIAEVQAYNVVVSGSLRGNVTANRVEITGSGKLWGDLNVNSLLLNEGAFMKGQTNMGGDIEPPLIEPPKITAPRSISTAELESANP